VELPVTLTMRPRVAWTYVPEAEGEAVIPDEKSVPALNNAPPFYRSATSILPEVALIRFEAARHGPYGRGSPRYNDLGP
jgi:hypothetical protein